MEEMMLCRHQPLLDDTLPDNPQKTYPNSCYYVSRLPEQEPMLIYAPKNNGILQIPSKYAMALGIDIDGQDVLFVSGRKDERIH